MILGSLKAGLAAAKAGAHPVYTLTKAAGGALEPAILADEIVRAVLGEDYDPALRDLAEDVARAGQQHDAALDALTEAHANTTYVISGIQALASMRLDFGARTQLVREHLDQLAELRQRLYATAPTSYLWFDTVELQTQSALPLDRLLTEVAAVVAANGPNHAYLAAFAASQAVSLGLRAWGHWRGSGPRPAAAALGETRELTTGSIESATMPQAVPAPDVGRDQTKLARLQTGFAAVRDVLAKGERVATRYPDRQQLAQGVWSGLSAAMGIHVLVQKRRTRAFTAATLRDMRDHYRAAALCYRAVIEGAPEHASEAQLREHTSRLTAFFAIDSDQISDSGQAALQRGFRRIQTDYNQELRGLLSAMDASYDAMISELERVATPAEQASITALRAAQRQHRVAEDIALASDRPPLERREQGISAARALFDASVCRELNDTLAELQQAVDNHNAYRMVAVSAGRLARMRRDLDSEARARADATIEQLRTQGVTPSDAQADEARKRVRAELLQTLTASIPHEAEVLTGDLNALYADRTRLRTAASVQAALQHLLTELSGSADEAVQRMMARCVAQLRQRQVALDQELLALQEASGSDHARVAQRRTENELTILDAIETWLKEFLTDHDVALGDRAELQNASALRQRLVAGLHEVSTQRSAASDGAR